MAVLMLWLSTFGPDEAIGADESFPNLIRAMVFVIPTVAVVFFIWVIGYVLAQSIAKRDFPLDANRLARDVLISIIASIASFALLYRYFGIEGLEGVESPRDYIYFSAVTFSTLGYGDFRPSEPARLIAATQAVLGNMHLGIIVGTALVAVKTDP
ncbi:MAG: ion channel [Pseudomonadota bacterium]